MEKNEEDKIRAIDTAPQREPREEGSTHRVFKVLEALQRGPGQIYDKGEGLEKVSKRLPKPSPCKGRCPFPLRHSENVSHWLPLPLLPPPP